ncbi:MAG: murein hydrolase activator EnvC family protein [Romboutsia sp.]|uniref:murein hydrolase activator EnvC family protein n=1 Tax=Romboutsia sp. TaxID=1965302 RepID=UPI003F3524F5
MKKIISVITACTVLFTANFIYADDKEQQKIDEKLTENRQEQTTLEGKIKELDSKIAGIEKNINNTNDKITKLDSEIETTKSEIENLENKIKKNEKDLGKRLKAINNNYSIGYMKVILSSTSVSDFFNNVYIVREVVEQDKEILKELDKNKLEIEKKESDLNNKKQEQEDLKLVLEQDNNIVQGDKSELEALKRELETEENGLEEELERLAAESAAKQAAENGMNSGDDLSGVIISSGSWPVPGYSRVSSPYGYRLHPVLNVQKMHTGVDIPAPTGTPVMAVDSGTITYSGVQGSYGNTIMIQHDDGKVSLYAHNSVLVASVGQRVEKGQVVSKIGSTGRSTGPHLHFEIRINGKHTNPLPYIK